MYDPYSFYINTLFSESLMDAKLYSVKNGSNQEYTVDYYGVNDDKYLQKWQYENFNYTINKYGFRYSPLQDSADIGAFGCSYTFGQSMPSNRLWHSLLSQATGLSSLNFGVPGKGIETTVDIFNIVSKHIKLKRAVFLLPPITRLQILLERQKDFEFVDYTVQHDIDIAQDLFRTLPESQLINMAKKSIYLAEHIARERRIRIYFASWHSDTSTILKKMKFHYATLLPDWTDSLADRARDQEHPGPIAHQKWVEKILPYFM